MRAPLVILFAATLLAGCGGKEPPPPWLRSAEKPRDENYHGGASAQLLKYDANHDGTLTRDELIAGLRAEFAVHDTRHNGCLDPDQTEQINQDRVDTDQSTATPIVDWNQDGCIDYTEFSAAPYSLFDQMDANRDGKITPKEFGKKPNEPKPGIEDQAPTGDPDREGGRERRGPRRGGPGGPPPSGQ